MLLVCCCDGRGMATGCIYRGEIPVGQMMCPVHFVFHNRSPGANDYTGIVVNVFADYMVNLLPLSGCKCGLVVTWQTSETREAVMSHILLCCVVKPPMWQTMA